MPGRTDLVEDGQVRFWLPIDDFQGRAVAQDVEPYLAYSQGREDFITARNARIDDYARQLNHVDQRGISPRRRSDAA